MEPTDWGRVHVEGMKGYEDALKRHEAGLLRLEAELLELRAGLRPAARLETVWFRRYAELMLALLDAGLPEALDVGEVGEWIRAACRPRPEDGRRSGDGDGSASADGGQTGSGMGSAEGEERNTGCGACAYFSRCEWLIGAQADGECDWLPSRFRGKGR